MKLICKITWGEILHNRNICRGDICKRVKSGKGCGYQRKPLSSVMTNVISRSEKEFEI